MLREAGKREEKEQKEQYVDQLGYKMTLNGLLIVDKIILIILVGAVQCQIGQMVYVQNKWWRVSIQPQWECSVSKYTDTAEPSDNKENVSGQAQNIPII